MSTVAPAPPSADALSATGEIVTLRSTVREDREAIAALYARCTAESKRFRFFTVSSLAERQDIDRLLRPPSRGHLGVVAVERGQVIAAGCLERTHQKGTAEFAMIVDDSRHGEGVGTLLLEYFVAGARDIGYLHLRADVLADNTPMLKVIDELGATLRTRSAHGVVTIEFSLAERSELSAHIDRREEVAEHASISRLLAPRSVAVVGAGAQEDSVGRRILGNLQSAGFTGRLIAVNTSGAAIPSVQTVASVRDIDPPPDLAIIAVPAAAVLDVIDDCAARAVYGAVIVSDGFAELGEEGRARQADLMARARRAGIRVIGPNCLGILNLEPGVRLNATFADSRPSAGSVGLASQSGGVGLALVDYLTQRGIGLSSFVSMGNKADVSGNDLLMYWNLDPATKVCALYLESFGNARKFARIARHVARTKPIVAITAGGSRAGARGVRSHTAAAATPDTTVDALFSQAGVIRARDLSEMLDIVGLMASSPLPEGRRVAVVTNGGGPGALAADACAAASLELPALSVTTQQAVARLLPPHAAMTNPIDTTAGASPDVLADVARAVVSSGEVDSVIVVHTSVRAGDAEHVANGLRAVARASRHHPILGVFIGRTEPPPSGIGDETATLATFSFPEDAANALSAAVRYADWRGHPPVNPPSLRRIHRRDSRRIVDAFLDTSPDGGWLDTDIACGLVESYGINVTRTLRVADRDQAVAAASELGLPVALKSAAGGVLHRTDVGAVELNLRDPEAVADAVARLQSRLGPDAPLAVQPMAAEGIETAVGVVQDSTVGPLVMVALGGVATDLLADRSFRLPPLDRATVRDQIRSLRSAPLLYGYRATQPADVPALEDLVLRVSQLATEVPELGELDLNPVIVSEHGVVAVDVKLKLTPTAAAHSTFRRLLPGS